MTKALSLTVFAELSNVTDGRTDNSRPDAVRCALRAGIGRKNIANICFHSNVSIVNAWKLSK